MGLNHTMSVLVIVVLVIFILSTLLVGALLFLRHKRRARRAELLPKYDEKRLSTSTIQSHHRRRVSVRPSQSIHIYRDGETRIEDYPSEPSSPAGSLPEIRITFPEEVDSSGKRQSGRVVVVHVGDTGNVGLEPIEDKLPAYEQREGGNFESVDLQKVGGLEETRPTGWR